jgi:hypothetical protein
MKKALLTMAALLAGSLALDAAAQPGPGMGGMQGMQGMAAYGGAPSRECAKARDPQRCEALQQAKQTCKDKPAAEKRDCMQSSMPPADCSKSRHPARCEAHQKAKEVCKDKVGMDRRQCMRDNTPRQGAKKAAKSAKKNRQR